MIIISQKEEDISYILNLAQSARTGKVTDRFHQLIELCLSDPRRASRVDEKEHLSYMISRYFTPTTIAACPKSQAQGRESFRLTDGRSKDMEGVKITYSDGKIHSYGSTREVYKRRSIDDFIKKQYRDHREKLIKVITFTHHYYFSFSSEIVKN